MPNKTLNLPKFYVPLDKYFAASKMSYSFLKVLLPTNSTFLSETHYDMQQTIFFSNENFLFNYSSIIYNSIFLTNNLLHLPNGEIPF